MTIYLDYSLKNAKIEKLSTVYIYNCGKEYIFNDISDEIRHIHPNSKVVLSDSISSINCDLALYPQLNPYQSLAKTIHDVHSMMVLKPVFIGIYDYKNRLLKITLPNRIISLYFFILSQKLGRIYRKKQIFSIIINKLFKKNL